MSDNHHDDDKTQTHIPLMKDTMVGHYRIVEKIGAGGMGEVYLAEDTELDRKVALKFLPSHLCRDEDCRTRFKREAQAAARLNHPNIIHVYEVSEYQGRPFFAMEHVEGQSLREYTRDERLPTDRILEIGIQICEGLKAAHEKGVTHRDIKPSNILIDSHGLAKILDFGLASIQGAEHLTKTGSTLGTIGYMSPEQVQGKEIDHRSDLFSLGVVLYELIAGQNPFKRDSEAATIQAILNSPPSKIAGVRGDLPPELPPIIEKLLAKNPNSRYQHGLDLLTDLKETFTAELRARHDSITGIVWARRWMFRRAINWGLGLVAIVVAIVIASMLLRDEEYHAPAQKRITFHNKAFWGAISGDGKYVAYTINEDTATSVFVRDLKLGEARRVFVGSAISDINWSPDGHEILFIGSTGSTSGIVLLPVIGGEHRLYPFRWTRNPSSSWSPDGTHFAVSGKLGEPKGIVIFEKKSGDTLIVRIDGPFESIRGVDWSPAGDFFVFNAVSPNGLWICRMDGSGIHKLADGIIAPPCWDPSGTAIYYLEWIGNEQNLMRIDVYGATGMPRGDPKVILPGIRWGSAAEISIADDGRKLVCTKENRWTDIWQHRLGENIGTDASEPMKLNDLATRNAWPAYSPDGRWLAYQVLRPSGEGHLYLVSTDGTQRERITYDNWLNWTPAWSPDGSRLAFGTAYKRGDDYKVAIIDRGGGTVRTFDSSSVSVRRHWLIWSPGEEIVYNRLGDTARLLDPLSGSERPVPTVAEGIPLMSASYSPSGKELAVWLDPTPEHSWDDPEDSAGVWIIDIPNESTRFVARSYGHIINWSLDGNSLFLQGRRSISRLDLHTGLTDTILTFSYNTLGNVAITTDGKQVACADWNTITDIWLLENFDPDIE